MELFHGVFVSLIMDSWHGVKGKGEAALVTGKQDGKEGGSDSNGDEVRHCIYLDGSRSDMFSHRSKMDEDERKESRIIFRNGKL